MHDWASKICDFEIPYGSAGIRRLEVLYVLRDERDLACLERCIELLIGVAIRLGMRDLEPRGGAPLDR